jgi:hypothetical protein
MPEAVDVLELGLGLGREMMGVAQCQQKDLLQSMGTTFEYVADTGCPNYQHQTSEQLSQLEAHFFLGSTTKNEKKM